MTTTPAIQIAGLTKSYADQQVLRGVDFDVARGSIFALLGSNGAGKTTAIKILATLLEADAETVVVNGFDVASQPEEVRGSISLTGQFAAVDGILTGRENLVLIAKLRHVADPGSVADDLLARFSLTEAGGRRVATYSGGMKRRLDIAMSLIGNPPVIFLDEPTTGLDPQARIEVWQAVKELAANGTTVLLTTQHLDEAEQLADRIAILHHGRIVVNGTLAELKELLPPAQVEYVEKQPPPRGDLPRGRRRPAHRPARRHREMKNGPTHEHDYFVTNTTTLLGRSLRHILRSPDTIITTAITDRHAPSLRLRLRWRDRHRRREVRELPAAGDPAPHGCVGYRLHGVPPLHGRLQASSNGSIHADRPLGSAVGHVLTSVVANLIALVLVVLVAVAMGFRSGAGVLAWLAVRDPGALHLDLNWLA